MKGKSEQINHFLLQEQFPDIIKIAGTEKKSNAYGSGTKFASPGIGASSSNAAPPFATKQSISQRVVKAVDHVAQLRLESCRCPHLEEYFPRILDLTLCRTIPNEIHPKGWTLSNPIHSLHMVASQSGGESSKVQKARLPPSFMYGEEHHRTIALQTEGIAEYWCSFNGNGADSTASEMTRWKDIRREKSKASLRTAFNPSKVGSNSKVAAMSSKPPSSLPNTSCIETTKNVAPKALGDNISQVDVNTSTSAVPMRQTVIRKAEERITKPASGESESISKNGSDKLLASKSESSSKVAPLRILPNSKDQNIAPDAPVSSNELNVDTKEKTYEKMIGKNLIETKNGIQNSTLEFGSEKTLNRSISNIAAGDSTEKESNNHDNPSNDALAVDTSTKECSQDNNSATKDETVLFPARETSKVETNEEMRMEDIVMGEKASQLTGKDDKMNNTNMEREKEIKADVPPMNDLSNAAATNEATEAPIFPNNERTWPVETRVESWNKNEITNPHKDNSADTSNDKGGNISEADRGDMTLPPSTVEAKEKGDKIHLVENSVITKSEGDVITKDVAKVMSPPESKDDPMEVDIILKQNDRVRPGTSSNTCSMDAKEKSDPNVSTKEQRDSDSQESQFQLAIATTVVPTPPIGSVEETVAPPPATNTSIKRLHLAPSVEAIPFSNQHNPSMDQFRREEEKIRRMRRSLTSKRVRKKPLEPSPKDVTKKKRKISDKSSIAPGWKVLPLKELTKEEEKVYVRAKNRATETTERWISQFRRTYDTYWKGLEEEQCRFQKKELSSFYLESNFSTAKLECQWCTARSKGNSGKPCRIFKGDEIMQCLDCGFIGCSPSSLNRDTKQHMQQHLLLTGHKFAVTCGKKAQIFCSDCGDFVYHEVFEQEKVRIACTQTMPHMAWNKHSTLRSFDPFQFVKTPENGVLWRGLVATYPPLVPKEHFCATQLSMRRLALFEGKSCEKWILPKSNALYFAASQNRREDSQRFRISAPVGIYNLGNTCFMSAVLQCLVFCTPLQEYFLRYSGHHFKSCEVFRHKEDVLRGAAAAAGYTPVKKNSPKLKKSSCAPITKKTQKIQSEVCLACELDRLFLSYFGATIGNDVFPPLEESSKHLLLGDADEFSSDMLPEVVVPIKKGDPLIISDLLTSAWKSGGMNHLTGYDQHDAHEFLNSFLELLGKHIVKYRRRIHAAVTKVYKQNAYVPDFSLEKLDIVNELFEGSLRSVLLCENCGVKRVQQEPFMNISLSLSEEAERIQDFDDMSVEKCLKHFVLPEKLSDLVYCNSCAKKTQTKKQHTFAKLPRILCLHLKRFDATKNKKIENFVSFPSHGLNMGKLLSHWCEVSRAKTSDSKNESTPHTEPKILYDLFGTVNHIGNMQSGHYVANVKVDGCWYHCNDQHVTNAEEDSVLKAEGAYMLFYQRR